MTLDPEQMQAYLDAMTCVWAVADDDADSLVEVIERRRRDAASVEWLVTALAFYVAHVITERARGDSQDPFTLAGRIPPDVTPARRVSHALVAEMIVNWLDLQLGFGPQPWSPGSRTDVALDLMDLGAHVGRMDSDLAACPSGRAAALLNKG